MKRVFIPIEAGSASSTGLECYPVDCCLLAGLFVFCYPVFRFACRSVRVFLPGFSAVLPGFFLYFPVFQSASLYVNGKSSLKNRKDFGLRPGRLLLHKRLEL